MRLRRLLSSGAPIPPRLIQHEEMMVRAELGIQKGNPMVPDEEVTRMATSDLLRRIGPLYSQNVTHNAHFGVSNG
jgi:hypothetical protein